MKNILFIFILLFSSSFANAQLFKSTPKKYSDLAFFHKRAITTDAEIISINEINLPNVEKVFPKAKLCDIFMEGRSFTGKVQSHAYFLLYKGKYYGNDDFSYLSEIEQKANKNKISPLSLKERIEAYTTLSFYKELNGEARILDMEIKEILNSSDTNLIHRFYNVNIIANGVKYNETVLIIRNKIINIYINGINKGINFSTSDDNKQGSINIINTDPPEYYNNKSHYFFKTENNANEVQIKLSNLPINNDIQCLFVDYQNVSTVYYSIDLHSDNNGNATYFYFDNPYPLVYILLGL
jgi:hypothetical protein